MNDNYNAALYFVERHKTGVLSSKTAFIEATIEARRISYRELATQTDKLAALYARHEIRQTDRAIMLVHDCIDFPVIFWGSIKAGIIPVPLNTLLPSEIYTSIFKDSEARIVFVSAELLEEIKPALADNPDLIVVVLGETSTFGHFVFETEMRLSETHNQVVFAKPEDCAFWLYSSGSTGAPKGVRHKHASLQATVDTYAHNILHIKESDIVYSVAKLFFAYGLGNAMSFPMSVGATTVLYSGRPTPESVVSIMERHKPSIFCGVPTLYAALLAYLSIRKDTGIEHVFSNIRRCVSAGEALPADIARRWNEMLDLEILDGVGSTELLHIFLSNAPGEVTYGVSGRGVPGYDLRLVDDRGAEVEQDNIGELLVKGPTTALDYWKQTEKSRDTFENGWTRTGDKYTRDADGLLTYCGRTDDMFKVSGIWVSPFEVEQALVSHDLILEAAVVACDDEEGLTKPKAYVVLESGIASDALIVQLKEHVKGTIGKWKYPRWIEFMESLPKTATGKIQRYKLRD